MQYILRVEHEDGKGVYASGAFESVCDDDSVAHPAPWMDETLGYDRLTNRRDWYFGFASIEQLEEWFYNPSWRSMLAEDYGLRLAVYSLPAGSFRLGHKQAIFMREDARLVEALPLDYEDKSQVSDRIRELQSTLNA